MVGVLGCANAPEDTIHKATGFLQINTPQGR
jgi:hypothetical protein